MRKLFSCQEQRLAAAGDKILLWMDGLQRKQREFSPVIDCLGPFAYARDDACHQI